MERGVSTHSAAQQPSHLTSTCSLQTTMHGVLHVSERHAARPPSHTGWYRATPRRRRQRHARTAFIMQQGSTSDHSPGVVQVRFQVPNFRLAGYGDTLRVCGENPVLGCWSVAAAPRMRWEAGDNWSVTLPLSPGTHEFKVWWCWG